MICGDGSYTAVEAMQNIRELGPRSAPQVCVAEKTFVFLSFRFEQAPKVSKLTAIVMPRRHLCFALFASQLPPKPQSPRATSLRW